MSADRPLTPALEPLLRRSQAAKFLNVSERTIARLTKDGLLPCVRFGRSIRYRIIDLKQLIRSSRSNSKALRIEAIQLGILSDSEST